MKKIEKGTPVIVTSISGIKVDNLKGELINCNHDTRHYEVLLDKPHKKFCQNVFLDEHEFFIAYDFRPGMPVICTFFLKEGKKDMFVHSLSSYDTVNVVSFVSDVDKPLGIIEYHEFNRRYVVPKFKQDDPVYYKDTTGMWRSAVYHNFFGISLGKEDVHSVKLCDNYVRYISGENLLHKSEYISKYVLFDTKPTYTKYADNVADSFISGIIGMIGGMTSGITTGMNPIVDGTDKVKNIVSFEKKYTKGFAVKSPVFSLYEAFRKEVEKIGWAYNRQFTKFRQVEMDHQNCMYFNADPKVWSPEPEHYGPAFVFLNCYSDSGYTIYDLTTEWNDAIQAAKEAIEEAPVKMKVDIYKNPSGEICASQPYPASVTTKNKWIDPDGEYTTWETYEKIKTLEFEV